MFGASNFLFFLVRRAIQRRTPQAENAVTLELLSADSPEAIKQSMIQALAPSFSEFGVQIPRDFATTATVRGSRMISCYQPESRREIICRSGDLRLEVSSDSESSSAHPLDLTTRTKRRRTRRRRATAANLNVDFLFEQIGAPASESSDDNDI